jgi:transcriptional regulator with XRE-family HTH domain
MTDTASLIQAKRLPPPAMRRALRLGAGLTLQEVGELVGVHRSCVLRWETGAREPTGRRRIRYSEVLTELRKLMVEAS